MTAGDLTPNMIGRTRIRTRFEDADIEGLITSMGVHVEKDCIAAFGNPDLRTIYNVTLDVTVGRIQMTSLPLDHPVQIIQ